MKKTWLSLLAVAAAFAIVVMPNAAAPNAAHAQVISQEGAGVWDYLTFDDGTVSTSYANFSRLALPSGGGDFKVDVLRNDTGGTVYARLVNVSTGAATAGKPAGSNGEIIFSGLSAANYEVQLKTTGHSGYVVAEYYD